MRGLRKPESSKFEKFFELVQQKAKENGCVFFLDFGEGRDFANDQMEGEDLCGWLVPERLADTFEKEWSSGKLDQWNDFIRWVDWSLEGQTITIAFSEE